MMMMNIREKGKPGNLIWHLPSKFPSVL